MSNQRKKPRRNVHEFGKVIFTNGKPIVSCVIIDLSEDGALHLLDASATKSGVHLPQSFVLHHKKAGSFREAKIVRRSGRTVAVRLLASLHRSEIGEKGLVATMRQRVVAHYSSHFLTLPALNPRHVRSLSNSGPRRLTFLRSPVRCDTTVRTAS
jgi:hypothetical protein